MKETTAKWTFLTNHAHILLSLSQSPDKRMRDLANEVGITERAVQRIIAELAEGGFINVVRDGRRNSYTVNDSMHLRHPLEAHRTVADFVRLIYGDAESERS